MTVCPVAPSTIIQSPTDSPVEPSRTSQLQPKDFSRVEIAAKSFLKSGGNAEATLKAIVNTDCTIVVQVSTIKCPENTATSPIFEPHANALCIVGVGVDAQLIMITVPIVAHWSPTFLTPVEAAEVVAAIVDKADAD